MNQQSLELVQREIRILKKLSHPNIVQLYEVLETDRVLFLIMEHASGGEALDFVVTHGKISEDRARVFFQQIVSSLSYCHKLGIIHRDLKAENLLLDRDLNIKIIDFGLANIVSPSKKFSTPCGSPNYAAPEIIRKEEYNGPEVDIWCMGVVLFVFLCGRLPFKGKNMETLFHSILSGKFEIPDSLSADCADLLRSMLENDTEKRITMDGIIHHPWVCKNWTFTEHSVSPPKIEKIEEHIATQLEELGFSVANVMESLRNNQFNQATATYNLLSKVNPNPNRGVATVSRTKSEFLGKYVSHPASTPSSLNPSPSTSRGPSPRNSRGNIFSKSPPKLDHESFAVLQQRRIAQARRTRGHRRNRSDLPVDITPETNTESKELEKVTRAQSESIKVPEIKKKPESQLNTIPQPQLELMPVIKPAIKIENNSIVPEAQKPLVILSPQRTKGHRRYKSEDRLDQQISSPKPDRIALKKSPATSSLWCSASTTPNTIDDDLPNVPKLTEQEIQKWRATEESERQQISNVEPKFSTIITW
eukprot:CAMPEP_0117015030 /NCGR_PEP_ID=MMETSP0472-20121206/12083_1 /TAXON_ID=693140 ORGANISM="Tiarina fusus, Strain LIS" /NCGR_SAMPLE_ID=MMETSP0472 /ASSEMBLY_ACC=CAM_ASM_000603 /LENGTH=532 /DNA_ID=CAMNT_0004718737 /DNA_START=219 /DNA_END=1814 /DNA_ORIENTATION=-